jgi:hypothetical protein
MDNNDLLFDTGVYRRACIDAIPAEFDSAAANLAGKSPAEREQWQADFRHRLTDVLGGMDSWERVPLDPVVVEVQQLDGYRRETIHFATRPGLRAFGYFLVPDACPPDRPTVLCVPGHGRGVDTIVGIAEDGTQRPMGKPDEYAADYALQCVANGYPTLAMELTGFGVRRDAPTRNGGNAGASTCHKDSMAALMLGESMAGWRVWDAMRALDYLETRTDCVDPDRLAILGCSGGGMVSLFTAALDTRIRATVVSAYFNTFAASVLAINHCVCNFVPNLLAVCEMPDLAALVAPRGLFAESGREDPIFPAAAFESAVSQARAVYADWDAQDNFDAVLCEGGHAFYGGEALAFLKRVL